MKRHPSLFLPLLFVSVLVQAQEDGPEFEALRSAEARRYQSLFSYLSKAPITNPVVDVKYYRLNIRIAGQKGYVQGDVTTLATVREQNLSQIVFDMSDPLVVDSAFVGDSARPVTRTTTTMTIALPRTYHAGDSVQTKVYYHGTPPYTGLGSYSDVAGSDGARWIYTLSEPYGARDWWPCIDHPGDKADSVDIWMTCDQNLIAVTNGKLIQTIQNGDGTKTYKWKHRYPIATYLMSVTIGKFSTFSDWYTYTPTDSMEVVNYVLSDIATTSPAYRTDAALTPSMIATYSSIFGTYPFIKEKYGHAEFGWNGGMEHQTLTSLGTKAFAEATIAHELVHQWFGDMITCRTWPDLWLNEGFAQYFQAVWNERKHGFASYWSTMSGRIASAKSATGSIYVQDTANVNNLFLSSRVYNKGSWTLHMLRHVLGDTIFFASMKAYASDTTLRYNTAATADFRRNCEKVSARDLGWFFTEWIYGEKYPKYTYSYTTVPDGNTYRSTVRIIQTTGTTNPGFFTMPVDLQFHTSVWDSTVTVFNNAIDQTFQITTSQKPDTIQFDPNQWILRDVAKTTSTPLVSQPLATYELSQNYPNPFNPATTFRFSIGEEGFVTLKVYDLLGKEVATLVNATLRPGNHSLKWNAAGIPGGVYFYRFQAGSFTETKKLILAK